MTKVGARREAVGAWLPAQQPSELRDGVEANLRSLGTDRLALVNLRVMDEGDGPTAPLSEQLGTLEDLRQEGKLDLIGLEHRP